MTPMSHQIKRVYLYQETAEWPRYRQQGAMWCSLQHYNEASSDRSLVGRKELCDIFRGQKSDDVQENSLFLDRRGERLPGCRQNYHILQYKGDECHVAGARSDWVLCLGIIVARLSV